MEYFKESLKIVVAVSQKKDGSMKLPSGSNNRKLFLEKMGLNHKDLATPVLEHGKTIKRVGKNDKIINGCDGLMTNEKGVILSVTVADCLPIFLFDPEREAIGLIHAGWRGISKAIIENAVNFFVKEFASQPEKIIAVIGPGLCQNHFEVGEDVAVKFANYPKAVIVNQGRILVDIKRVAEIQLKEAGLILEKIQTDPDCTFCLNNKYFSYRRDGPRDEIEAILCILALKRIKKHMHHKKTIVGGTFDHLHKGHKALLEKAFKAGQVSIGLTSDRMAEEKKKRKVENYKEREHSLRAFAKERGQEIDIRKIEDAHGFSIEDDFKNIVVSKETRDMALEINKKREKAGKKPLKIIEVGLILAKDGKPISSTRIYNNEIDREGNPV